MRGTTTLVLVEALALVVAVVMPRPAVGHANPSGSSAVVEGTIAMSVEDDFQSGRATRHYFLDQSSAESRYELRLTPRQASAVQPGLRVRVTGKLVGNVLTADQGDESIVVLDAPARVAPGGAR